MWNAIKAIFVCLTLSLFFSGSALAAKSHDKARSAKQKISTYVFDTTSESFADILSPGVTLGQDISSLFRKKSGATWTINSAFLYIPSAQQGLDIVLAFNNNNPSIGWQPFQVNSSVFNFNNGYFQPAILLAFYQEQITAVPEASAGAMMAMGLPVLGWLVWRRQRSDKKSD